MIQNSLSGSIREHTWILQDHLLVGMLCVNELHSQVVFVYVRLNLSQSPDISRLQQRLYSQLHSTGESMPDKVRETTEQQTEELIKAAKGKLILVVLDDLCECSAVFSS